MAFIFPLVRSEINRTDTLSLGKKIKLRKIAEHIDALDFQGARDVLNEGGGGEFTLAERKLLLDLLGAEDANDAETTTNLQDKEKSRKRINKEQTMPEKSKKTLRRFFGHVADNIGSLSGSTLLTDLVSWWTLDEATGAARADSTGTYNLTDATASMAQTTGQVNEASVSPAASSRKLVSTTFWEPDDVDFTIAGWLNISTISANQFILGNHDFTNGYYLGNLLSGAGNLEFEVRGTQVSQAVSTGAWHMFVLYHDATNNEIGFQLDDGAAVTTAHSTGANTTASSFDGIQLHNLYNGAYSAPVALDEVAVWSRILTGAEITELWNSGSGISYSDL